MRVLVVTTWFPHADRPSVAPFNLAHVRAIARDHDVRVVHARFGGTEDVRTEDFAGLTVTRVPVNHRKLGATLRGYRELRRQIKDADIVHSMAFSSLGVLAPLAPLLRKRWVHSEHWSGIANPASVSAMWRRLAGARHLLRLPRAVSVVSSVLADIVVRYTRKDSVEVIPCVVAESFRSSPQPPWRPLHLLAVGGLVPGKRPHLAVDTVAALVAAGEDVRLTWVGDGPLRTEVHEHAARLGLTDQVSLIGDVAPEKVAEHVRAANIFFLPTAHETFLTAGAEAIACGRPVVLPGTGGFVDYVTPANGVIAAESDPDTLATAIRDTRDTFACADPEALRATVIPRFSESAVAARFTEFYRRLES